MNEKEREVFWKQFDDMFKGFEKAFRSADQVAYGAVPLRRRSWLSRAKTPAMLLLHVAFPLSIIMSWLLFPLWFAPLHSIAWGPIEVGTMSNIAGALHGLAMFLPTILIVMTTVHKCCDNRWWWNPAAKD